MYDLLLALLEGCKENVMGNPEAWSHFCALTFGDTFVENLITNNFFDSLALFKSHTRLLNIFLLFERTSLELKPQLEESVNSLANGFYMPNKDAESLRSGICVTFAILCYIGALDPHEHPELQDCFGYILENSADFETFTIFVAISLLFSP